MDDEREAPSVGEQMDSPTGEGEPRLSAVRRLTAIFFSPGEVFADINLKPTWLVPVLLSIVATVGYSFYLRSRVNIDIEQIVRHQMEQREARTGEKVPEAGMEAAVRWGRTMDKFKVPMTVAATPIVILCVAGVFFLAFQVMQAQTTFKKAFAVVAWAYMARTLVEEVLNSIVLTVNPQAVDPLKPDAITMTNAGAFFSAKEISPSLHAVLSSMDIFSIWLLMLLAIGFSAISRKMSIGKSAGITIALWVVYVVIKAGFSSLGGS